MTKVVLEMMQKLDAKAPESKFSWLPTLALHRKSDLFLRRQDTPHLALFDNSDLSGRLCPVQTLGLIKQSACPQA